MESLRNIFVGWLLIAVVFLCVIGICCILGDRFNVDAAIKALLVLVSIGFTFLCAAVSDY